MTTALAQQTWVHLHLPRLKAYEAGYGTADVISVKVPGERVAYTETIALKDATFKVSKAGRDRCVREGVRNVHAWIVGTETFLQPVDNLRRAIYDPFQSDMFVDSETLEPLEGAGYVVMVGKLVYYDGEGWE